MQMSLVMSMRFIFGDDWNDACKFGNDAVLPESRSLICNHARHARVLKSKYPDSRMRKYYTGKILFCVVYWGVTILRILSQLLELYSWIDSICCMYLIDKFSQLLRCEVLLHFINTWDIKYIPLEATSTTCLRVHFHCRVIFTCVRAWYLRSQI